TVDSCRSWHEQEHRDCGYDPARCHDHGLAAAGSHEYDARRAAAPARSSTETGTSPGEVMASLKGSKTEKNLKAAFAGESLANRRYLYFAQKVVDGRPEPAILVLVGRYGLSTSWPDLFRPSPQHGAAMDGRNKSGHDDVATRWAKMRIAGSAFQRVGVRRVPSTARAPRPVGGWRPTRPR